MADPFVCAAAACMLAVLPPAEYDKPYPGGIAITVAKSKEEVRSLCNHTPASDPIELAVPGRIGRSPMCAGSSTPQRRTSSRRDTP